MPTTVIETLTKTHLKIAQLNGEYIELWKNEMVFTWRWWLNVGLLVLPWVLWLLVRKRESTNRLLLAGMFVYLINSTLDSIGVAFGLWFYAYTPLPYLHTFFLPWDFGVFPVIIMLFLQYKPDVSPYVKALIFSLMSAFLAEPLFTYLGVYIPLQWEHAYGVPIHFIIYLIAHRVSRRGNFQPIEENKYPQ